MQNDYNGLSLLPSVVSGESKVLYLPSLLIHTSILGK